MLRNNQSIRKRDGRNGASKTELRRKRDNHTHCVIDQHHLKAMPVCVSLLLLVLLLGHLGG